MSSSPPVTVPSATDPALEPRLARWIENQGRSVLRRMVAVVSRPGILSLAGGLPAAELFPTEAYARALQRVLAEDPRALQYGPPVEALKQQIVDLMRRRGVDCAPERVVITSGAQQGIDVSTRLLLDNGSAVALESIAYTGIQQTIAPLHAERLTLPCDVADGLDVDAFEACLDAGARPAFLYLIPDAHNPMGTSLPPRSRERLAALARQYGFWLVEDDPYGLLSYDGGFAPPLVAFAPERTLYLGSFSKILAPALRLGWMVVPEPWVEKVQLIKDGLDLESSALTQRAVTTLLDDLDLDAHLDRLRSCYSERRDALLEAVRRHLPAECRYSEPQGGMFVWVDLPEEIDAEGLLQRTLERERVAFIPGVAFAADRRSGRHSMRLSFSTLSPETIDAAVASIARCL